MKVNECYKVDAVIGLSKVMKRVNQKRGIRDRSCTESTRS